jgi:3-phosphoshikimate 1-carboxyvinyltransferase
MAQALAAVGVRVEETDDGMEIDGGPIRGGRADSAGDHRVAMSLAIAGLVSREPIEITDTAPVATSFPGFATTAGAAGLAIATAGG